MFDFEKLNVYKKAKDLNKSVYECVSLLEIILEENQITKDCFDEYYVMFEQISKMLLGLINSQR